MASTIENPAGAESAGLVNVHPLAADDTRVAIAPNPGPQVVRFDYSILETDKRTLAQTAANLIRVSLRNHLEAAAAIGEHLLNVKQALDHGQFLAWLRAEVPFSERSAQTFMNVAENIGPKSATVADLPLKLVYQLASPIVPDKTRQEIIARREAGERIDKKEVGRIVSDAIYNAQEAKRAEKEAAKASDPKEKAKRQRRLAEQKRQRAKREAEREEWEAKSRRKQELERELFALVARTFAEAGTADQLQAMLDELPGYYWFQGLKSALRSVSLEEDASIQDGAS